MIKIGDIVIPQRQTVWEGNTSEATSQTVTLNTALAAGDKIEVEVICYGCDGNPIPLIGRIGTTSYRRDGETDFKYPILFSCAYYDLRGDSRIVCFSGKLVKTDMKTLALEGSFYTNETDGVAYKSPLVFTLKKVVKIIE